jgi:hypothetical protein
LSNTKEDWLKSREELVCSEAQIAEPRRSKLERKTSFTNQTVKKIITVIRRAKKSYTALSYIKSLKGGPA